LWIDGLELAHLMMEYGLGVVSVAHYDVKGIDPEFFGVNK
jgi:restriction endonuclease Mrr